MLHRAATANQPYYNSNKIQFDGFDGFVLTNDINLGELEFFGHEGIQPFSNDGKDDSFHNNGSKRRLWWKSMVLHRLLAV